MNGWGFVDDTHDTVGTGQMVSGPDGQPLGAGSAELTLTGSTDGQAVATLNHEGTRIASIIKLDYSTYTRNTNAIALQLAVAGLGVTGTKPWHRLVYEPSRNTTVTNEAVMAGKWQRWNPTAPGPSGAKWWITNTATCGQSTPCTWDYIKITFPNATISGGVWLKAGSGWMPVNNYNVDAFLFVALTPLSGVLYDFEPDRNNDSD
jgi:hypothetical protein